MVGPQTRQARWVPSEFNKGSHEEQRNETVVDELKLWVSCADCLVWPSIRRGATASATAISDALIACTWMQHAGLVALKR
jgi:hypothetical protein